MTDIAAIPPNCIAANSDIAGVGIRITIYLQNIICLLVAIWAVTHRDIPPTAFRLLHAQTTGIILTTGALFSSAFIQARSYGLSAYHAIVILNLGWVNMGSNMLYTNIVLIHRSLGAQLPTLNTHPSKVVKSAIALGGGDPYSIPGTSSRFNAISAFWMHVSMGLFSGFGLWFWSTVDTFGSTSQCRPGLPIPISILGHTYLTNSPATRKGFLAIYILFAVTAGIGTFRNALTLIGKLMSKPSQSSSVPPREDGPTLASISRRLGLPLARTLYLYTVFIDIGFLVGVIVGTERLVHQAASVVQPGESQWTYGQTISLFLLAPGVLATLHDLIEGMREKANEVKEGTKEGTTNVEESSKQRSTEAVQRIDSRVAGMIEV